VGRQGQLEERNEIAKTLLQSASRAISAAGENECAFYRQRRYGDAEQTVATTGQRSPPHVGDGK
jgi:hypothetical protein